MQRVIKLTVIAAVIIFSLLFVFATGGKPNESFMFLLFFIITPLLLLYGVYLIVRRWFEKVESGQIYKIKSKTIGEFIVVTFLQLLVPYLFILPIAFLFKSAKSETQRVAIPPSNLRAAKVFMLLSIGYWWYYLRYFAKACPNCNCVWYKELIDSNVLDKKQELYTYKDTVQTEHFNRDMQRTGYSKSTVDKVGVKNITTAENTYQCANCHYTEMYVETSVA